jgi:hypothetical protein
MNYLYQDVGIVPNFLDSINQFPVIGIQFIPLLCIFKLKRENMSAESIEITRKHIEIIESVIALAVRYEDMMDHKRKLGITGEVGEIRACFKYDLRLMLDSQSAGYDAIDSGGNKVQIKTRRSELGKKLTNPTRISSFSQHDFNYCLLLLLDKNYDIDEVWKADSLVLEPIIRPHKRRNPTLGGFKRVAEKIFDKKA